MQLQRVLMVVGVLAIGVGVAFTLIKTAPKPQKKPVQAYEPLVETAPLVASEYRPSWQTGGTVNAKPSVKLMAQVSGQIIHVNEKAVPGAQLKKGALLAQIDSANYQLIVEQKQAALIQAQSALDIELGQVKNAENDYKLSNLKLSKTAKSLALREPQLASAKAALDIAQAELKKAKLDLSRTQLRMPFDGHVMSLNLVEGSYVSTNTQVFELLDSSEFWLQVKVPAEFANLLDDEFNVSIAKAGLKQTRNGYIKHILPAVDAADRQVRVLVGIREPLNQDPFAIRFNDYVNVQLFSRKLENVYQFPSDALNTDGSLWVVDNQNTLQLREANIVYKGRHHVWANIDAKEGDVMMLSRLQIASPDMPVRIDAKANAMADEAKL